MYGESNSNKPKLLIMLREDVQFPSGGLGVYVINIIKYLKQWFDVTILCLDFQQITKITEFEGCRLLKIGSEIYDQNPTQTNFVEELNEMRILQTIFVKYMKDWKFDLISLQDAPFFYFAEFLKEYYNAPIVTTIHLSTRLSNYIDPKDQSFPFIFYMIQKEFHCFIRSDKVVTVSYAYKEMLENLYLFKRNIYVIHNGVDSKKLLDVNFDIELKNKLSKGKKLVVFVGRMVCSKGIELILDVIKNLPDHMFILISNLSPIFELISPLAIKVEKLKNEVDNLDWLRNVDDDLKFRIMKVADIGIVPSLHEPFGLVALEWLAIGTPLIVSNVGGLVEFCNESNSTLIEPTKEALEFAIKCHHLDRKKVENGVQTAKSFSWKLTAEKLKNVYSETIYNKRI